MEGFHYNRNILTNNFVQNIFLERFPSVEISYLKKINNQKMYGERRVGEFQSKIENMRVQLFAVEKLCTH